MVHLALLWLLACSVPCESAPAGPNRDACLHERVALDTERWTAGEVARFAEEIGDPIVRGATVMVWVRNHRGQVRAEDRDQLCGLVEGLQRQACERRLETAHLSR